MSNSVYYVDLDLELNLSEPDLDQPDFPGLWEEFRADKRPVHQRGLQCPECRAANPRCPEWMVLVERDGQRFARHHNPSIAEHPTNETDEHKAYKDRVAKAADDGGLEVEIEDRSVDGRRRTDVLVRSDDRAIGWEIQLSYTSLTTVRKRSKTAQTEGITPLWATPDSRREFVNKVPWTQLPDASLQQIKKARHLLLRGGVRKLQFYRCSVTDPIGASEPCPRGKNWCGQLHGAWMSHLGMNLDDLVRATGTGEYVPIVVRGRRITNHWWVSADDRDRYADSLDGDVTTEDDIVKRSPSSQSPGQDPRPYDPTCHYGEDSDYRSPPAHNQDSPDVVVTAATIRSRVPEPPVIVRPKPGVCGALADPSNKFTHCEAVATLYACGWRCERHRPGRHR